MNMTGIIEVLSLRKDGLNIESNFVNTNKDYRGNQFVLL